MPSLSHIFPSGSVITKSIRVPLWATTREMLTNIPKAVKDELNTIFHLDVYQRAREFLIFLDMREENDSLESAGMGMTLYFGRRILSNITDVSIARMITFLWGGNLQESASLNLANVCHNARTNEIVKSVIFFLDGDSALHAYGCGLKKEDLCDKLRCQLEDLMKERAAQDDYLTEQQMKIRRDTIERVLRYTAREEDEATVRILQKRETLKNTECRNKKQGKDAPVSKPHSRTSTSIVPTLKVSCEGKDETRKQESIQCEKDHTQFLAEKEKERVAQIVERMKFVSLGEELGGSK